MDYKVLKEQLGLSELKPNEVAPLILAYIGDAVYEVAVRTVEISKGNRAMNRLHRASTHLVNAKAQADMIEKIMPMLTEEEVSIYKRGRNAKSNTSAKNASIGDYRKATGFEALIGYLFLCERTDRMVELIKESIGQI